MAITGRPPSGTPRNRNAKGYDWTTVENTPWASTLRAGTSPLDLTRSNASWYSGGAVSAGLLHEYRHAA
ncbi:hypothetical protein GCM10017774_38090 [Lentzea cavernae]|uniref:Uncharacterized protein n=1 Tax=Lentzea cavernae TaxID=2020703 RepID=A0ABQ3MPJ7_9PSEU|nr:hypothetical protein GCM10017774_38090 [Lentzea cavernae]